MQYPEAAAAFREALEFDDSLAAAHVNLSLALLHVGDLEGAAREAHEADRLLPSAPQPPYVLGLIARAEGREADAIRFFQRVQQIDADDVGTNVNLGQIYLQDSQYAEAIVALRAAVVREPYSVTATYNLGLALTRAGQSEEGEELLERSQALRTTGYATVIGTGYLEQGTYAEALVSTGAEPELVDTEVPSVAFTPVALGPPDDSRPSSASPFGRRFPAGTLIPDGAREIGTGLAGGVTLIDVDGAGSLELFVVSHDGTYLLQEDGGTWRDVTASSGLDAVPPNLVPVGGVAADYDNDGHSDLFVLAYGGNILYRNEGDGRFTDVTAAAGLQPSTGLPSAAAFVDVDHDGDLDLVVTGLADPAATRERVGGRTVVFPREFAPAPIQLLRNHSDGTFTDITSAAGLDVPAHAVAIVPTDFDNRRDIDLLIVNRHAPPLLFRNLRDGTFQDVAADVGLAGIVDVGGDIAAVATGDVNKDDFPDFFFAGANSGVIALSDGRGQFRLEPAPAATQGAVASQFLDYDSDGLLDLLTWSPEGPRVFRNLGQRWSDATPSAVPDRSSGTGAQVGSARELVVADVNGDGHTDLVTGGSTRLSMWLNSGDTPNQALRVRLEGRASNRLGIGSKIQIRAGSLSGRLETSAATPAVAPADTVFGLGRRPGVDAARVLWPSGILQAEVPDTAGGPTIQPSGPRAVTPVHRGTRPQTVVMSVSLFLERLAFRVRHRLSGRRRDGVLDWPGSIQPAGPHGVRAHPGRPTGRGRRSVRGSRHERARRDTVHRSRAADGGRPSPWDGGLSERRDDGSAEAVSIAHHSRRAGSPARRR